MKKNILLILMTVTMFFINGIDAFAFEDLTYKNSCEESNIPSGYDGICRYKSDYEPSVSILLVHEKYTNKVVYLDSNTGDRLILGVGSEDTITTTEDGGSWGTKNFDNIYKNNITSKINVCPSYIYINNYEGVVAQGYYSFNNNIELSKDNQADKTTRYELKICEQNEIKNEEESCDLISKDLQNRINDVMNIIRIAVPIILIAMMTYDFACAVLAGEDDKVRKAKGKAIKRIIIAIVIFFVPTFINLVFNLVNEVWGTNFGICDNIDSE